MVFQVFSRVLSKRKGHLQCTLVICVMFCMSCAMVSRAVSLSMLLYMVVRV